MDSTRTSVKFATEHIQYNHRRTTDPAKIPAMLQTTHDSFSGKFTANRNTLAEYPG